MNYKSTFITLIHNATYLQVCNSRAEILDVIMVDGGRWVFALLSLCGEQLIAHAAQLIVLHRDRTQTLAQRLYLVV